MRKLQDRQHSFANAWKKTQNTHQPAKVPSHCCSQDTLQEWNSRLVFCLFIRFYLQENNNTTSLPKNNSFPHLHAKCALRRKLEMVDHTQRVKKKTRHCTKEVCFACFLLSHLQCFCLLKNKYEDHKSALGFFQFFENKDEGGENTLSFPKTPKSNWCCPKNDSTKRRIYLSCHTEWSGTSTFGKKLSVFLCQVSPRGIVFQNRQRFWSLRIMTCKACAGLK